MARIEDEDELDAQITAQVEEWSSNSNECTVLELVNSKGESFVEFEPAFTYPIFGDEEAIFGYQGLRITISFSAHNLRPHVGIQYGQKFKAQGEVRPTDIIEALRDFLPEIAFIDADVKTALSDDVAKDFTPPGEKIADYSNNGETYEVWCASLSDSRAREIMENMQILVPMLIEGGSTLQLGETWTVERWKLFLFYKVTSNAGQESPYSLIGYGTSYRVFTFPDRKAPDPADLALLNPPGVSFDSIFPPSSIDLLNELAPTAPLLGLHTPLDLPSRERISQFLILPPYHASGHGQNLYRAMYTHLTSFPNVRELTVEDPSEAFDDMRDLCDLLYLRRHEPEFASLQVNTSVPPERMSGRDYIPIDLIVSGPTRAAIMKRTKIDQRQFDRLVELHTLSFIPLSHRSRSRITRKEKSSNQDDRAYYFWRLYCKQRLYIFNRDQLVQLDREERVEKLEAALDSVQEGYVRMLERVERHVRSFGGGEASVDGVEKTFVSRGAKRKIVDDDEEDSLLGAEDGEGAHESKKPRAA